MTGLLYSEAVTSRLSLAILLRDGFTGKPVLLGDMKVAVQGVEIGYRKPLESTFLFESLPAGLHIVNVKSIEDPPLYLPTDLTIVLPQADPVWPAFPDRSVADPNLPFDSPLQTALFRSQYLQSLLIPSVAYPFPGDATLVRGTVSSAGGPLDQASVIFAGRSVYLTGRSGEFVVPIQPYRPSVSLTFQRPGFSDSVVTQNLQPQQTSYLNIVMTP